MKQISKFTLAGYVTGAIIIILASIRYFLIYPDTSQGLIYIFAGSVILALSWVYNQILSINNTIQSLEEYLADDKNN